MLNKVLRLTIVIVFAITGLILMEYLTPYLSKIFNYDMVNNGLYGVALTTILSGVVGVLLFGAIGYAVSPVIIRQTMRFTEVIAVVLAKAPTTDIFVVAFGVMVGLVLANLFGAPFSHLPIIGPYLPLVLSLVFSIIGAKVALRKHSDIISFFDRLPVGRTQKEHSNAVEIKVTDKLLSAHKLIDTSVVIDGRISDILKTGFLEGKILIPQFVVEELQKIADSGDSLKRNRGRRGLDVVKQVQTDYPKQVEVCDFDFDDMTEVDAKLVKLAKQIEGVVVTNDFNLNKVADINGVQVLNINDLANAVKPVVLPGEEILVFLVKEGKENGQAVAYLEDGTMIVVEGGRRYVGDTTSVVVTSVLQTSAGRMIFARVK